MANIYSIHVFSFLDLYLKIIVYHIQNSNCLTQNYLPLQFLENKQEKHIKSVRVTKNPVCIYVHHIYAVSTDVHKSMYMVLTFYKEQNKYVKVLRKSQLKKKKPTTSSVFQF